MEGTGVRSPPRLARLCLLGAAGPVVYLVAVLVGGFLWPGYSQYGESVSTLTSAGAPNQLVLQPLFAAYNVCLIALGLALNGGVPSRGRTRLGPAFLMAAGGAGLLLAFFPQDPWGAPVSGIGTAHIAIAAAIAVFFLVAMGFLWGRFRTEPQWHVAGEFTLVLLVVGLIVGPFGAVSVSTPYAGLAERLSIGTFLVWTEGLALLAYARLSQPSQRPTVSAPQRDLGSSALDTRGSARP